MDRPVKYEKTKRLLAVVAPFAWLAVLAFAIWSLGKEWGGFHLEDLNRALRRIGFWHVGIALVLTAASLLCNASLDLVALRWLKRDLPPVRVLGTALIAATFSMNGGGTILGGGAIRLRFYAQYGIGGTEVAKITGFLMVAGLLGHALLAGVMMCWAPPTVSWLSPTWGRSVGVACLVACAAVCALSATRFRGRVILPPWRILLAAMFVSGFDWLLAGLALRVFLPAEISTPVFLTATAVGQALGAASHVPGGVGVMELFITKFTVGMVEPVVMVGALMTYRLTYYLIPFMIAIAAVGCREVWAKRHWAQMTVDGTSRAWSSIAPRLAGMTALAGGFVMLFSAATPMDPHRRMLLEKWIPLALVEAAHFLTAIAGVVMILVASGLLRRVQKAWWIAVLLAGGGIVFSLVKGLDWEEAFMLLVFFGALLPFRARFHRHAGIWTRRFSLQWWGLILSIVGLAIWFGFYASEVAYTHELWWQFSFANDASRLLRGMAGSALILVFLALLQYFHHALALTREPPPAMDRIQEMVANTSRSGGALALAGDKEFLFNFERSAFLMYRDHGRTRVAMADPIGDEEKFEGLYWRFMEQAQDEGMKLAFYQVGAPMMPVCVEMGLQVHQIGEAARVPLDGLDPESGKFREAMDRMDRGGWLFEIWQPAEVAARIGELRPVSDAWLGQRGAREKGFSSGKFDADYLGRLPVAVILVGGRVGGRVTAFGVVWPGNGRDELSTDLMRHMPDAPDGVMECLLVNLMLWGRQQGYRWFDLGESDLFAASDFQPVWEPRYLAVSNNLDLAEAVRAIAAIGGG